MNTGSLAKLSDWSWQKLLATANYDNYYNFGDNIKFNLQESVQFPVQIISAVYFHLISITNCDTEEVPNVVHIFVSYLENRKHMETVQSNNSAAERVLRQ